MDNEELIFDFMAAAEDTGKRLDEMAKRLPGEMKAVLLEEWRRSPWLTELPKTVAGAREATKEAEAAARSLTRTVKKAGIIIAVASTVIPLATLGMAYCNLSDLRGQQVRLERKNTELAATIETATRTEKTLAETLAHQKNEIQKLSGTAEAMRNETGGLDVMDNGDGSWEVTFPASAELEKPWRSPAGRFTIPYTISRNPK